MLVTIIPVFNKLEFTKKTVESYIRHTSTRPTALIVVDDASTDNTATWMHEVMSRQEKRVSVYYHKNDINQGVHKSWNIGLELAQAMSPDYICIANNDLEFTHDWDSPLIRALQDEKVGVVSPYHSWGHVLPTNFPNVHYNCRRPNPNPLPILGCCFMTRASYWKFLGKIPEEMRHYYGDNWICEKSKKHGFECKHISESYIHHYFSQTTAVMQDCNIWFNKDKAEYERLKAGGL